MGDGERLHFTIGPVQTFVAQSRRTRDLWASSYLLSHLADVAMTAVEKAGGTIVLPSREKQVEQGTPGPATAVKHGRWPNRFIAIASDSKGIAKAATSCDARRLANGRGCRMDAIRSTCGEQRKRHESHLGPAGRELLGSELGDCPHPCCRRSRSA